MKQQPTKYTVDITKLDGMKSIYFVLALSAGAAEETCLREVYNAQYALAEKNWPESVKLPDLTSKGVTLFLTSEYLKNKGGEI